MASVLYLNEFKTDFSGIKTEYNSKKAKISGGFSTVTMNILSSKEHSLVRHIVPYVWWLVLLLGILGACGLTTVQEQPLRLRLATWPGYAPLYAVAEQNLAAPTEVEISTSELAQDNYRAFAEGRVDVLATTLYSAIQFHEQGTTTVIILITDYSNGADAIIARPGIEQVSDLQGQRVGVESGSISHFVLLRALEEAGLGETDVHIVHIGVSEAIDAIEQDEVDAAVVWEPILSGYTNTYDLEPIFTSADLPNEVVDVLVVHPDILEQRTDDLINLARGWDKAVQGWRDGSPEIRQAMADGLNVDVAQLQQDFTTVELIDLEDNTRLLDLDTAESIEPIFDNLVSFLQRTGQLEGAPPAADELLNPAIVQAAQPERSSEK